MSPYEMEHVKADLKMQQLTIKNLREDRGRLESRVYELEQIQKLDGHDVTRLAAQLKRLHRFLGVKEVSLPAEIILELDDD